MIIKNDGDDVKRPSKADEAARDAQTDSDSAETSPPPYSGLPSSSSAGPVVPVKPCNLVAINRSDGQIKGSYFVDPTLAIPSSLLPDLPEGETRKNISLSTANGEINVELTILPVLEYSGPRVTLGAKSSNGTIKCKLRQSPTSPPFSLECYSANGSIAIYLPRTFEGTVSATRWNGSVHVSDQVAQNQTHFSDVSRTSKFFIGDVSQLLAKHDDPWPGSEIVLETKNGSVKIFYEDEMAIPSKGFWKRFFS